MNLPNPIPLFPLGNVVLMPGTLLPLHLFEPRYREMARDALEGDKVIGMVLLRGDWEADYYGRPETFEIGTGGRIVQAQRLDDGRYNILLEGLREFRIQAEYPDRSYRYGEVEWRAAPAETSLPSGARGAIRNLVSVYARQLQRPDWEELLSKDSLADDLFVNNAAHALHFSPLEKMSLLEAETLASRAERLRQLLEFRIEEVRACSGSPQKMGRLPH